MGRHSKNWNTEPYDQNSPPAQKADEFEAQYAQNRDAGQASEQADPYNRPEPEGSRPSWSQE